MKKTLLFSSLVIGIALTGCNKSTRTSTAANDPAATDPYATTNATSREVAADVRAGADDAGDAVREAGRDTRDVAREAGSDIKAASREAGQELREFGRDTRDALANAGNEIEAKFAEWKLDVDDIQADLAADRPIVRTKSTAGAPTGTMDKSTLQTAVEGRIKADSELANLKLDVNAEDNGEIELEGKAQNAQQVARAMGLALDTDGVQKVTSKIDLDDDATRRR